jgi:hypothetical protein
MFFVSKVGPPKTMKSDKVHAATVTAGDVNAVYLAARRALPR